MKTKQKIIIAGPCAAESQEQVISCAKELKKRGIKIMRASLWKPRTQPGFEGVGIKGIPWLAKVTKIGITVATEVLLPEHVSQLAKGFRKNNGDFTKLILWLGSRNQNHLIQRLITKKILEKLPNSVNLIIKNQGWRNEKHWVGIVEHVLGAGFPKERIILCHRGFAPFAANPAGFRNEPDFAMAMKIKEKTDLPMVIDPSHIGGTVDNVFRVIKEANQHNFDGMMVEVHPEPKNAQSDAKQQLNFSQLDQLLKIF